MSVEIHFKSIEGLTALGKLTNRYVWATGNEIPWPFVIEDDGEVCVYASDNVAKSLLDALINDVGGRFFDLFHVEGVVPSDSQGGERIKAEEYVKRVLDGG